MANLNKAYELRDDIDLSVYTGTQFNRIGIADPATGFTGTFDGNLKTISNFSYSDGNENMVGLFSKLSWSTVSDVVFEAPQIVGQDSLGVVAGESSGATLNNVHVRNATISGTTSGGLVGFAGNSAWIIDSSASGTLTGQGYMGGLVALTSSQLIIQRSFSDLTISGATTGGLISAGGLVGESGDLQVESSFALGSVTIDYGYAGGLVGQFGSLSTGAIFTDSYSRSNVSGVSSNVTAGGFIGNVSSASPGTGIIILSGRNYASGTVTSAVGTARGFTGFSSDNDTGSYAVSTCYYNSANGGASVNPIAGSCQGVSSANFLNSSTTFGVTGYNWDTSVWTLVDGVLPKLIWE